MTISKNNRWLSFITIILLLANVITLVLLWTKKDNVIPARNDKQHPGQVFEFLTKELQLDERQQAAYGRLRDEHQSGQRSLQDSIRNAKDALFGLLQQDTVPDSLLQQYLGTVTAFEEKLDIVTFRHFQQVRTLCDPAQQKKFDAVIKEAMSRMVRGRPPGPGNHPPPGQDGPPPPGE